MEHVASLGEELFSAFADAMASRALPDALAAPAPARTPQPYAAPWHGSEAAASLASRDWPPRPVAGPCASPQPAARPPWTGPSVQVPSWAPCGATALRAPQLLVPQAGPSSYAPHGQGRGGAGPSCTGPAHGAAASSYAYSPPAHGTYVAPPQGISSIHVPARTGAYTPQPDVAPQSRSWVPMPPMLSPTPQSRSWVPQPCFPPAAPSPGFPQAPSQQQHVLPFPISPMSTSWAPNYQAARPMNTYAGAGYYSGR